MLGALIVGHNSLARELHSVLDNIVGETEDILDVSIEWSDNHEAGITKIEESLKSLSSCHGIIIFTDMFGGTPTNISLPFLEKDRIEIITGVNLPMLIKFVNLQKNETKKMQDIIQEIKQRAQQSIKIPGDFYYQKEA